MFLLTSPCFRLQGVSRKSCAGRAVVKLRGFISSTSLNYDANAVGRQMAKEFSTDVQDEIFLAALGARSPSAVSNALLHFDRRRCAAHTVRNAFSEEGCRVYVRRLRLAKRPL